MALPFNLADLAASHLEQLVATGALEGSHLDFKRQLPVNWDYEAKKRFIADVTAFANAGGGDLVFGMDEGQDAQAAAVVPQQFASVDVEVRRLLDFTMTLVEPRLPGVQVQAVPVATGVATGHALVVRIPQSWAGPHRSKVDSQFYVRDGVRNRQLDVPEIRALFLRSDSQSQRMRDFRSDRLAKIVTGQMPIALGAGPKLVIHALASQAVLGQVNISPQAYTRGRRSLPVIGTLPASPVNLNLDGAFAPAVTSGRPTVYTQQFRQGFFEAVWELVPLPGHAKPALPGLMYEQYVIKFLEAVRTELAAADISQELVVFLSLVGADEAVLAGPSDFGFGTPSFKTFDRRDILLPDVLIAQESSVGRGMRPAYDLMHQAAGFEGSPNFNATGEWQPPAIR